MTEILTDRQHTITRQPVNGGAYRQYRDTVKVVANAILRGAEHLPIRNHAAALATLAPPKDYLGQARAIYADFVKNWRYVKDPIHRELVETSPDAIYHLIIGKGRGLGFGLGGSDCDGVTVAMGALLASIGHDIRICTIAPPGAPPGNSMTHIFIQDRIPGYGWVTVDPVVHPAHGFGFTPPASRFAFFDLRGNLTGTAGNAVNMGESGDTMSYPTPRIEEWNDFQGFGDTSDQAEPDDFQEVGLAGFGVYADQYGIMDASELPRGIGVEVETDETGLCWAPAIELAPNDYNFVRQTGAPYHGMLGLTDEGEPVYFDGGLGRGFFRKLFKRVKKFAKKVARKAKAIARKVLKKIPGGKMLMKVGKKLWSISKKLIKPLMAKLGPLALKLAPIAALFPGIGTAVAAGLATTGAIYKAMKSSGIKLFQEKAGDLAKIKFTHPAQVAQFKKALKIEAAKKGIGIPEARAARRGARGAGARMQLMRRRRPGFSREEPRAR